jgi:SAM-dependent methyltransferase
VSSPVERFALSFGNVAELYDDVRPDYPPEALDRPVEELGLTSRSEVVDLAAGTGKLTRLLVERFDRVVAVEPDERMRAVLEARTPSAVVLAGRAEDTTLESASADAVFVADAFHWFAGTAALEEIERVLRPRGGLILAWNDWWHMKPPLPEAVEAAFDDVFRRTGRIDVQARLDKWQSAFEGARFEELSEEYLVWELELPAERLAALYLTPSSIAALPAEEREQLRELLGRELTGLHRLPVETRVYWTRRV